MAIEIKVPAVGESVTEAMVDEWLVQEGHWVAQDDPLVVIETEKASMEIPAPVSGILTKILKKDGEYAAIDETIGTMEEASRSEGKAEEPPAASGKDAGKDSAEEAPARTPARSDTRPDTRSDGSSGTGHVMPAARRELAQRGLKAEDVQATGPGGRLLKEDVLRHSSEAKSAPPAPASTPQTTPAAQSVPGSRETERVRMTPLRKTVARRLVEAQHTAAMLTTFNEIDMSAVMALRQEYKDAFLKKHGVKLGFMSFFVKAVIEALKEVPGVNAQIEGDEILYHHYYDIGVAVGGGKGLVVPVIRNAEQLSFAEVEKTIGELAERARDNKLQLEELQGGTFTISNGGIYGSLLSTPILNPPQSGILGMHKIEERPVAVNGEVVIRPMMYVALSYDHRLVDGREAVTFLVRVKAGIEDPTRILLEV